MITIKKNNLFSKRHIGVNSQDRDFMLQSIGYDSMDSFIDAVVPENILEKEKIDLGEEKTEEEALDELKLIAQENKVFKSFIGQTKS